MQSKYLKQRFKTSKEELKKLGDEFTTQALPSLESLYRASFWILLDKKSTDKIIVQVFLEAIEDCDITKNEADWQSWIQRIWIREMLDFYSERENDKNTEFSFIENFHAEISKVQTLFSLTIPSIKIVDSLRKLPAVLRIPLIMREVFHSNYDKISDLIDAPIGVAATRIYRARKLLTIFLLNNEFNYELAKNKCLQANSSRIIFELRKCSLLLDNEIAENEKAAFVKSTENNSLFKTEIFIQSEIKKLLTKLTDEKFDTISIRAQINKKASKRFDTN